MENIQQPQVVPVAALSDEAKVAFYKKTYAHVAGGVMAFYMFETLLLQSDTIKSFFYNIMGNGISWLLLLGAFMFITNYVEKTALKTADKNKQYLAYGIYILAEALIFVPLLGMVIDFIPNSSELLTQASIITLTLFGGLTAVVFVTKKDFSFLKSALTIGFFIAMGLIIAGSLFGFNMGLWFSVGMCVLAGGSILYQTSNLVHEYTNEQYIPAAIGLFASLMLLFWYVIQLFLSRD